MIQFSCIKGHYFEKTEEELREAKQSFRYCWCGEKLKVENLSEVVALDIKNTVEKNVTQYYKILGLEGTLEIIERLKDGKVKQLYQEELRKRGLLP